MEKPAYQTDKAIETLIEEVASQRAELLAEAERNAENLTPELVHSLGERGFQLASNPYTYPAQAEYLMSHLAAVTQNPGILDLAHKTIDDQFASQPEHVRASSHANAEETSRLVAEGIPVGVAGQRAIANVFEATHGMSLDDALLRDERFNPNTEVVSKVAAYNEWMSAETKLRSVHNTDKVVRQIVEEGLVEVAELVAAQVIPEEDLDKIHLPTPPEAILHRKPEAVDLFVLAQTVNDIRDTQPHIVPPLKQAVQQVAEKLPEDVIPVVIEELNNVHNGSTTSAEALHRLSITSSEPVQIAA